jgi:hypothetical protein
MLVSLAVWGLAALPGFAQSVGLSGTITNKANGQKLQGVIVRLVKANLADTTDSLGAYRIGNATGIRAAASGRAEGASLFLAGSSLSLRAAESGDIRVTLFNLLGAPVAELFRGRMDAGVKSISLPSGLSLSDLYVIRLERNGLRGYYEFIPSAPAGSGLIPIGPGHVGVGPRNEAAGPQDAASRNSAFGKMASAKTAAAAAAVDTLRISRSGYKAVDIALDAFTGVHDAALQPEGTGCAAGVLCWDFEEGKIPDGWTAYRNEFTGTILVDGTKPHKGAFALHAKDLMGGKEGSQGGPKKTIKYTLPADFGPVLWGRAYVYMTPARPASHAGLFNARYPRPGSTATAVNTLDWYEFATYQQTYMAVWHPPEPPGFPEWVLHSDKPAVLDAWACLEWAFDGANGDAPEAADPRVWVDGYELSWPEKFTFSDPAGAAKPKMEKAKNFTFLETGVYLYQGLPQATNWWIDDLAVGARRIGCN